MEIEAEEYKRRMTDVLKILRSLDTELLVYRYVVSLIRASGMWKEISWDDMLGAARTNPALENIMSQKYDSILQSLLAAVDRAEMESKVRELLRQWKPSTPPN